MIRDNRLFVPSQNDLAATDHRPTLILCAELDTLTFDKIVDGNKHVLVRFDKEYGKDRTSFS
jgi:hypothetical protein